jgi:hypothetical protein
VRGLPAGAEGTRGSRPAPGNAGGGARQGIEQRWLQPLLDAVDEGRPEFEEAFDDDAPWGPAKQFAAVLQARGVDLEDREAVEAAMSAYNVEQLARRLLEGRG